MTPTERSVLNVECWTRELGRVTCPVIRDAPLEPQADRVFLEWSFGLRGVFVDNLDAWRIGISLHKPLGKDTAIAGWRERRGRWAAQVIEHQDKSLRFFEVDFDASNPNWGAALAFMHFVFDWCVQKIRGAKTSPFKVAKHRKWNRGTQ